MVSNNVEINDHRCLSVVTKNRTYDYEVVRDEDIDSLVLSFQALLLRRNSRMFYHSIGKFLWSRIRYRL